MGNKFLPGNKLGQGRPKGTLNQRSLDYAATLAAHNFNPAAALLDIFKRAMKDYEEADPEQRPTFLNIAMSAADKMQPYVYPKLSSVEVQTKNPLDGMTAAEKLEAMRQAVKLLEAESEQEVRQIESK